MPLSKGNSKKSFIKNLKTEIHEGKPMKQSLAIAYAMKRKGRKKMAEGGPTDPNLPGADEAQASMRKAFKYAEGGQITDNYQSPSTKMHQTHDGEVDEMQSGFVGHEGDVKRPSDMAMAEDDKDLNQKPVDMHKSTEDADDDLVMRIMRKRYSMGGKVANDTGEGQEADEMPNQFDDLVLDDDLDSSYGDDDNAGDALGNEQEDEDRKDIVSRIMASRRKKDRLPNPA